MLSREEAQGKQRAGGDSAAKMPSLSRLARVWSHRKTPEHELYHLTPGGQEQPLTRVPFNRWGDRRQLPFQPGAIFQRTSAVSCYQLTLTAARGWRTGRWKERGRKHHQHPLHLQPDFHYTLPATLLCTLIQHPIIWLMLLLANYLLLFTQTTANWVQLLTVYSLISKNSLLVLWPPQETMLPHSHIFVLSPPAWQSTVVEMTLCNLQGRPWEDLKLQVGFLGMFTLLCKKTWPRH